jgi:hypothetical protein
MCIPFLLLIAVANCDHLLSMSMVSKNSALYSEGRAYKRVPKLVASPQLTAHRQHLCRGQSIQEQSRPQQHTWNSKPFVIFSAEITAAQSLHLQHLRWTEVVNSRRLK